MDLHEIVTTLGTVKMGRNSRFPFLGHIPCGCKLLCQYTLRNPCPDSGEEFSRK